jgi:Rieske Fe-S protein
MQRMGGLRRPSASARIAVVAVPAIGGAAVGGLWWYAEGGSPGGGLGGAPLAYSIGRLVGLLAGYLLMVQLLLASKLPWFRRRIGLGTMIRWHRVNGAAVLTLAALHVVLIVSASERLVAASSLWGAFTWLVSTRAGVPLAVAAGCLFAVTGTTSVRAISRRLGYRAWHAVHLLGYAAVGLAVPHQVQSGTTLAAVPGARVVWVAAYVGAGALLVGSRWLRPLLAARRRALPSTGAGDRSRREALQILAGAGVGAGLTLVATRSLTAQAAGGPPAACPTAHQSSSPAPAEPSRREVAAIADVPGDGALDVSTAAGEPAYLVRADDDVRLLSAVCTHAECLAAWRPEVRQFQCPCHLGTYDQQGNVVSGPPPRPLAELPIVVESGTVYLEG